MVDVCRFYANQGRSNNTTRSKPLDSEKKYLDLLKEVEETSIEDIASRLDFKPVQKKPNTYKYVTGPVDDMPEFTYTVADRKQRVDTFTSEGFETSNVAELGDIIMSGPTKEKYVLKPAKFLTKYTGKIGGDVVPEQSYRLVAKYTEPKTVKFMAPWDELMVMRPGDYLVQDGAKGYYRIAAAEYDMTYGPLR